MKKLIGCRSCDSPSCEGCNIYILETMLCKGKFDRIMHEHTVNPYADIVEAVRCKDCKFHTDEEPGMVYCPGILGNWVNDDWYCADGERKEKE